MDTVSTASEMRDCIRQPRVAFILKHAISRMQYLSGSMVVGVGAGTRAPKGGGQWKGRGSRITRWRGTPHSRWGSLSNRSARGPLRPREGLDPREAHPGVEAGEAVVGGIGIYGRLAGGSGGRDPPGPHRWENKENALLVR